MFNKLAWRNIWRNPRRTTLTVLAISFATAVLMFFMGIQLKAYEAGIAATTSLFHGHFQIQQEGYLDKPQMRTALLNPDTLTKIISQTDLVESFSKRGSSFVLASTDARALGAQIFGVIPETEKEVSTVAKLIRSGRYLSANDGTNAVIGAILARNLKASLNDEITILGQGKDGSLAASLLRIVGIFESGSPDLDRGGIFIHLDSFNEIFSMEGEVHTIVGRLKNFEDLEKFEQTVERELRKANPKSVLLPWDKLLPGLKESIQLDMAGGWMFFTSLIIIICFSVLNTFLMSVLERKKEFSIIKALGLQGYQLQLLILIEAFWLAVIGIIFGILLGSIIVTYLGIHGFSIPGTEEIRKMWQLPAVLYPELSLPVLCVGPFVTLIAALLSSLYPSFKAKRQSILEGMGARG